MSGSEAEPEAGQRGPGHAHVRLLGADLVQRPTASQASILLAPNPYPTGRGYTVQVAEDGEVEGIVSALDGSGAARMSAYNEGTAAALTVQIYNPVHVRTVDGREQIVYRTSEMAEGVLYPVEWNGDHYALRRLDRSVEMFKFVPDGGSGDGNDQD